MHGLMINADLSKGRFISMGWIRRPNCFARVRRHLGTAPRTVKKHSASGDLIHGTTISPVPNILALDWCPWACKRGDVVSILSEDSKEWMYTDMGVQSVGAICSGVYTTDSAVQLEYLGQ